MADIKDDVSTDIEAAVQKFAKDMTAACATMRKSRIDKAKKTAAKQKSTPEPPVIAFALDPNPATESRTPAEQAAEVAAGKSWVCWGAHMSDKARHVIMRADGKVVWDAKKVLGDDFDAYRTAWAGAMKSNSLKNAGGKDGWHSTDSFHLELADAKISRASERAGACLQEYTKLSRQPGAKLNDKFERDYAALLKPYVDAHLAKEPNKNTGDELPAILGKRMVPFVRAVRAGETMPAMIALAGHRVAVLISRRAPGPSQAALLKAYLGPSGAAKILKGSCIYEDNALTFVLQRSIAGLAKKLKPALYEQTGLRLAVRVRGQNPGKADEVGRSYVQ